MSDLDNSTQDGIPTDLFSHPVNPDTYNKAVRFIAQKQSASTSFLQHHLNIGYTEAVTVIEKLEIDGLIGKADGVHKRAILITTDGSKRDGLNYENR